MKNVSQIFAALLFATPLFASAQTATCPTPKGQPLTIQTVMIDFGRYVTPADDVTNAGLNSMGGVTTTDAQIQTAITDLGIAAACADAVTAANGTDPNLIPSAALNMPAAARASLVSDFLDMMLDFHDSVNAYKTGLTTLLQTPVASRDYAALAALKDACAQSADHAHSKLGQEMGFAAPVSFMMMDAATLKNEMHQIGGIFRQISSTMTDASQNQANAALATQLVSLFQACAGETPDSIKQLPAAQQAAAMTDYASRLQQEATQAQQLSAAFTSGNLQQAQSIVAAMTQGKTSGHAQYNP